jgi:hypothetical protein
LGSPIKLYKDMSKQELSELLGQHTDAAAPQALIKLMPAVVLLSRLTEEVRTAVSDLIKSSNQLERLTRKLVVWLTVVLAFLTVVLALPELKNAVLWLRAR